MLIGTTAEALLASLPCRIKGGKCQFSGGWLLPAVNPAVVRELQDCVPWGVASAAGHWLWCWAARSWDSASPELLCHYSAIPASCQQYNSMLPGTECNRWDDVTEDCHWGFPLWKSWMWGGILVVFSPSSFKLGSHSASCRIGPNKPSCSSLHWNLLSSCKISHWTPQAYHISMWLSALETNWGQHKHCGWGITALQTEIKGFLPPSLPHWPETNYKASNHIYFLRILPI